MNIKYAMLAGLLAAFIPSAPLFAQAPENGEHILNLTDVDIKTLIEDVGTITGYTFVIHPDVRATVTVTSQAPMSTQEVFEVFLSTLRVNGFVAIPDGRNFYRIVPEAVASFQGARPNGGENSFETQLFRLENFSAVEAAKMIQPLLGPQGQVTTSPESNVLIIVEYGSNLARIRSLIREIDEDQSITKTIALKTVPVAQMQTILTELQEEEGSARGRSTFSAVSAVASNSIILRGDPVTVERAAALIRELDVGSGLKREIRVLRLSHIQAETILPILREIADVAADEDGPAPTKLVSIAVHEPSNALIISAIPETLSALAQVVSQLDVRRKQVLVEAIIVQVSDSASRELGLQFLVAGQDGDVPFASSTFSRAAPNLLALTGALAGGGVTGDLGEGGTSLLQQAATASLLGLTGGTVGFGGQRNGTLFSVVLNALEADSESNVLSTPSIMALNNQSAEVSVGQEIPISSGQVLGDANLNPFQTTERQRIGVILNVTPRIGDDNTIQLDINQEVSTIASTIGAVTPDFILNQSILQTSVIADDGELIVLGGLIQTEDSIELEQVPILGDLPGIGRLFQSKGTSRDTTNLMVFIRPTIVADKSAARALTKRNYNYVRTQQIIANDGGPASIDQFVSTVLDGDLPEVIPQTEGE